jgi:hypothetical protein
MLVLHYLIKTLEMESPKEMHGLPDFIVFVAQW